MPTTTISHLTCEYRTNPLGIDVHQPRLSWKMQSDQRGAHQTAYQILVAPSDTDLERGVGLLWDSGKIESDQSIQVPYHGPALVSGQRVHWKVRVWNDIDSEWGSDSFIGPVTPPRMEILCHQDGPLDLFPGQIGKDVLGLGQSNGVHLLNA